MIAFIVASVETEKFWSDTIKLMAWLGFFFGVIAIARRGKR